jgi:NAD(P)H-nitrite reductase large subunit
VLNGIVTVQSAILENGEMVSCELVVAGIGVKAATEPMPNSGIEVPDGIVVKEFLETNQRDIYLAGDVASYYDVFCKVATVLERCWTNTPCVRACSLFLRFVRSGSWPASR